MVINIPLEFATLKTFVVSTQTHYDYASWHCSELLHTAVKVSEHETCVMLIILRV